MNSDQREYWRNEAIAFLALSSIKGVGYWSMHAIASTGMSFRELLRSASPRELEKFLRVKLPVDEVAWSTFQLKLWKDGVEQARRLTQEGIDLIFAGQDKFPRNLTNIVDPPYWLFVQGKLQNLHCKSVAIVGTRKPTGDGIYLTKSVLALLADLGFPTISGIATGIDQLVHEESLRYELPTIAILGTGIDENYPKSSSDVRARILSQGGTVISEYLLKESYSAANFIRRNRLQAALSETIFPIEWQIKSGTAHTVEFAHKYKKTIINVYLPMTYELRPELAFSEKAYGATSYSFPSMTGSIISHLKSGVSDDQIWESQQCLGFEEDGNGQG